MVDDVLLIVICVFLCNGTTQFFLACADRIFMFLQVKYFLKVTYCFLQHYGKLSVICN